MLVFHPSDKIFLDFLDIYMTCSFAKLFHYHLRPYMVEKQVGFILYCLKLLFGLQRLYLMFLVLKITTTSNDPILRRFSSLFLDLVIIDREEE